MATSLPMADGYPRPIREIRQIEMASSCNLRCVYCSSPKLHKPYSEGGFNRAKQFISEADFRRALEWAKHFQAAGTQGELALTGLGEALLHPQFVDFVRLAREALPSNLITFSTNGILVTEELCEQIVEYNPRMYVSLHRPEKAKKAIDLGRRYGLLDGTNNSFATDAFNWAGGVDWDVSIAEDSVTCEFLRSGWCVVLASGDITACCLDSAGGGIVGHVNDEIDSLAISPWFHEPTSTGCSNCHMRVPAADELRQL